MRHWVGPWGILIAVFWQNHCWDKKEGRDKATRRPLKRPRKPSCPRFSFTSVHTPDFQHDLRVRLRSESHRSTDEAEAGSCASSPLSLRIFLALKSMLSNTNIDDTFFFLVLSASFFPFRFKLPIFYF